MSILEHRIGPYTSLCFLGFFFFFLATFPLIAFSQDNNFVILFVEEIEKNTVFSETC